MTQPTDPQTPPVTDPATPPAAPQTPPVPVDPGPPAGSPDDNPWADPAKAQAEIERLRRENAASRTTAKQQAAEEARTQLLKDLGLIKDDTADKPDPAKLSQDIAERDRLLAVYENAPGNVNVRALMDSVAFRRTLSTVDAADPAALVAAIEAAVQNDPRLKATPGAAPVGGAQQVGSGSAPTRTYTREQLRDPAFFAANRADILAAHGEGRIRE